MKALQLQLKNNQWREANASSGLNKNNVQLVIAFAAPGLVTIPEHFLHLQQQFPNAGIAMGSTAGEILGNLVYDNTITATAIEFESTMVKCVQTNISQHTDSFRAGSYLIEQLPLQELAAIFILSDGGLVNGSELLAGINEKNTLQLPITGGLAGDGANFNKTFVGLNEVPAEGNIIAIGLYGTKLKVGHGSFGGWDEFGPEKTVTRSNKNVLHELDGKNALDLYKEYLGPYQNQLPGSALLFPLSLKETGQQSNVVRTILSIDNDNKTMTFAGNLPEGSSVRLMKANFDKLVDAASVAATQTLSSLHEVQPQLVLLVSCVGRKLILQDRIDEEVEAANDIFGKHVITTGFYSYGEISPLQNTVGCGLHNQTMTITTFTEVV